MRYAHRVDANHKRLSDLWRGCGATFIDTSDSKRAGCDGFVAFRGRLHAVEIKDGAKARSARQLTHREQTTREALALAGITLHVIETEADALALVGAK